MPELAGTKAAVASERLGIDRWFSSPDGLILRIPPTLPLSRLEKERIVRKLSALPAVEFATTASAAPARIRADLLTNPSSSDTEIPDARLRGFRQFDKVGYEAKLDFSRPREPGVVLVAYTDESLFAPNFASTLARAAADHAAVGATVYSVLSFSPTTRVEVVHFDESTISLPDMVRRYNALTWVEYAEPNYTDCTLATTSVNDPYVNDGKGLHLNLIQAPQAWDIIHDTNQIVAVIDTGLFTGHPDIAGNVFADLSGTNLVNGSSSPVDDETAYAGRFSNGTGTSPGGHGTHVSGIIAANANNGAGSCGVAWSAQLLPIKIFNQNEISVDAAHVAQASTLATNKGAKIINCSFGGGYFETVHTAIAQTQAAGAVVIAAAGNLTGQGSGTGGIRLPTKPQSGPSSGSNVDDDISPVYPACFEFPNLAAVAYTNADPTSPDTIDTLSIYSRFGRFSVDLAAPGTPIWSTLNQNSYNTGMPYGALEGTSMAAPHVTGTIALARQLYPQSTAWELLDRVRMGVDQLASLGGLVFTDGRLNAYKALLPRSKMYNLSCRGNVQGGSGNMINGFILRSDTTVVIRGLGPTLGAYGIPGTLGNPYLQLFDSNNNLIAFNDNWQDSQAAQIQATGLAPPNSLESAIYANLTAGSYTAILSGVAGGQGVGLAEVYELADQAQAANDSKRLTNASSRVYVGTGSQTAILGLIVHGQLPRRVLIRALGPTLNQYGISNYLSDPQLTLLDSGGNVLGGNNNWKTVDTSQTMIYSSKLRAAGLAPSYDQEAAIVTTLAPGSYTVQCSGADGGVGIALIDAYEY